ncbi:MAG: hypothetical protein RR791_02485, partial [Lachnospiraceae bacterium]
MNVGETKMSDIDEMDVLKGFIALAQIGISKKEEIQEKIEALEKRVDDINSEMGDIQVGIEAYDDFGDKHDTSRLREIADAYGLQPELQERYEKLNKERNRLSSFLTDLEGALENYKNFDKSICFSNIRFLLKEKPDIKIGQIEKEASVRLGYTARLEKPDNTSEPSIEFVVSAAKMLEVSLDTLLMVDLTGLTPTEEYLVSFIDKLKSDTIADKLEWNKETADSLNRPECDMNGYPEHPLLSHETFFEESECDYPEEVERIVFVSNAYGPKTYINDDCFNLRLKNGSYLYLMDISKSVHRVNDPLAFAKEIWMYKPGVGAQFLIGTRDGSAIAQLAESLYEVVNERNKHPKIKKELKAVIDAFMADD